MSPATEDVRRAYAASIAAAVLMVGQLVASRALRDGFFLTHFDATALPTMMVASAVFSVSVVLGSSRMLRHVAPAHSLPVILGISASLFLVEWAVAGRAPRAAAVLIYLHVMSLSAVGFSGFWSVVNERFDPYKAKQLMPRITGGASLGGVIGGVAAWWGAGVVEITTMILILGVLNGACALVVLAIGPGHHEAAAPEASAGSAFSIVRDTPYLQHLLGLVILIAFGQASYDYVFKSTAASSFTSGPELVSFFALFYMALSVVTLFVQNLVAAPVLRRFGLSFTAGVLPGSSIVLGVVTLLFPGLASAAAMRGGIGVAENSLFRSGYELLYTPVLPEKKRPTKALIDVGGDKIGTAIGGGAALLVLAVLPAIASQVLLLAGIAAGVLALWVTRQLHRGYIESLAERLRAGEIDAGDVEVIDATTELTLVRAVGAMAVGALGSAAGSASAGGSAPRSQDVEGGVGRTALLGRLSTRDQLELRVAETSAAPSPGRAAPYRPPAAPAIEPGQLDEVTRAVAHLRSGDAERVRFVLRTASPLAPQLVSAAIPAIARPDVGDLVFEALRRVAPVHVGALIDAALDRRNGLDVRRRLCDLLGLVATRRCVAGLVELLDDEDFELRLRAASSLLAVRRAAAQLEIPTERVFAVAEREAAAALRLWKARASLDPKISEQSPLESSAGQQVLHRTVCVWTLLLCVLERGGLTLAIRALASESIAHRGTGLEYLEQVLPDRLFELLKPVLDDERMTLDEIRTRASILDEVAASGSRAREDLGGLRTRIDALRAARGRDSLGAS